MSQLSHKCNFQFTQKTLSISAAFFIFILQSVNSIAAVHEISADKAHELMESNPENTIIIDVRNGHEYDSESIPMSVLISQDKIPEYVEIYKDSLKNKNIIVHCRSRVRGAKVSEYLFQTLGSDTVYNLTGGIQPWSKTKSTIKDRISIHEQVMIFVGIITAISSLLAYFKNKKFLFINLFFGAGLAFAGITGFCGLAMVLKMMPWNS